VQNAVGLVCKFTAITISKGFTFRDWPTLSDFGKWAR